jgi:AbrB family looped-hinge helix DNA binding protein
VRITSKGQVTVPQDVRNRLGLLPHTEVEFEVTGNYARIRKARHTGSPGAEAKKCSTRSVHGRYAHEYR